VTRVIVHHAHHPDEHGGIFRLLHAEQSKVTVYDTIESPLSVQIVQQPNPNFVPAPADGEEDERTDEERKAFVEEPVEVQGPPQLVERTETVEYDHQEIVWDANDKRWEGKSDQEIVDAQREDVRNALTRAKNAERKEARAATRRAKSTKHFDSVGDTL
jgi:hypothetical protein